MERFRWHSVEIGRFRPELRCRVQQLCGVGVQQQHLSTTALNGRHHEPLCERRTRVCQLEQHELECCTISLRWYVLSRGWHVELQRIWLHLWQALPLPFLALGLPQNRLDEIVWTRCRCPNPRCRGRCGGHDPFAWSCRVVHVLHHQVQSLECTVPVASV